MIPRKGGIILLAGLLIHAVFLASLLGQFLNPLFVEAQQAHGQAGDYYGIYTAGSNLVHGYSIYDSEDYRNEAPRRVPYFYFYRYLPQTAMIAAPGTMILSPAVGYAVWVLVTELLLAFVVFWILRGTSYPLQERCFHAALWLGFFPFYLEQWMGQFSFLMAFFLWILLRKGMPDRPDSDREKLPNGAALWVWMASVGLKSFTALFGLTYLRLRRVRPVVLCAGIVLATSLPYYLARPEDLREFLRLNMTPLPPGVHGGTLGAAAFVRLLGWSLPPTLAGRRLDFGIFDVFGGNVPLFGMAFAILAVTIWAVIRHGRCGNQNLQLSLWTLAFFLIFKDVWEYHYVMLLPVVTALGLASRSRFVLAIGILLALPTPYILFCRLLGTSAHSFPLWANLIHHASKALPTGALYVWTLARMIPARPTQGSIAPIE